MSSTSPAPSVAHYRATVGALSRSRTHDDPDLVQARASLREARIVDWLRREVDTDPPLPADVRARIAASILGGTR